MRASRVMFSLSDNGGRRSGVNRRIYTYTDHIPERRDGPERRSGMDRRSGQDRRSGRDRRNILNTVNNP